MFRFLRCVAAAVREGSSPAPSGGFPPPRHMSPLLEFDVAIATIQVCLPDPDRSAAQLLIFSSCCRLIRVGLAEYFS